MTEKRKQLLKCPKCKQLGHVRNVGCCGIKFYRCFPCGFEGYPREFPLVDHPKYSK